MEVTAAVSVEPHNVALRVDPPRGTQKGSAVVRHEMVGWSREEDDLGVIALKPKSADAGRTA